jgi:hypothetical protein
MNFGSKAPSQFALDAVKAARSAPVKMALTAHTPSTGPRAAPKAIRLDAGVAHQWPVRDQYGRGTCVAFAALAAVELHRALRDDMPPERLSEQFLHERMRASHPLSADKREGMPEGGLLLHQALSALEQDGVVGSEHAPYKPIISGINGTPEPTPSPATLALGLGNLVACRAYGTIGTVYGMDPARVDDFQPGEDTADKMLGFLREGLPVAVGLPLFPHPRGLNNWIVPSALRSGTVHCPDDADAPFLDGPRNDGHVVCLTGYEPDEAEPSGGWFVFRNSWGLGFGTHCALPSNGPSAGTRGYGLLSATHINNYCWEYLVPVPPEANAQQ